MKQPTFRPDRRRFLITSLSAGAGLTLGVYLPALSRAGEQPEAGPGKAGGNVVVESRFEPNAFVRITPDNRVIVIAKHLEMGQGTYTGLAHLLERIRNGGAAAGTLHVAPQQIVVTLGVGRGRFGNNLAPVGFQLLGHQGGQTGEGALTHLQVLDDHRHRVIRCDTHKGIWLQGASGLYGCVHGSSGIDR